MATHRPNRIRTDPPSVSNDTVAAGIHQPQPSDNHHRRAIHHRLHSNSLFSRPAPGGASNGTETTRGEKDKDRVGTLHSYRQHARDAVLHSAIELKPPISFEQILRRGGGGSSGDKDKSADGAGRSSGTAGPSGTARDAGLKATDSHVIASHKPTQQDVTQAIEQNALRAAELRDMLSRVQEMGMSNTRQLDDTYYSILERAAAMRSTITALQRLADEVDTIRKDFENESKTLESDAQQSVDGFEGGLAQQEGLIENLAQKLKESRLETEKLNEQLERTRLRVEAYEKRVAEKDAKRRTRYSVAFVTVLSVGILIVAIILARNRRAVGSQLDAVGQQLAWFGDAVEDVTLPLAGKLLARPSPSDDPYLRKLFDDL